MRQIQQLFGAGRSRISKGNRPGTSGTSDTHSSQAAHDRLKAALAKKNAAKKGGKSGQQQVASQVGIFGE